MFSDSTTKSKLAQFIYDSSLFNFLDIFIIALILVFISNIKTVLN